MGNNNQHVKDESRSGDGVAFYTALVRRYIIAPSI